MPSSSYVTAAKSAISKSVSVNEDKLNEIAELKALLEASKAENAELKAENAELKAENAELKAENTTLKEDIVLVEQANDHLHDLHKDFIQLCADLRQALYDLSCRNHWYASRQRASKPHAPSASSSGAAQIPHDL